MPTTEADRGPDGCGRDWRRANVDTAELRLRRPTGSDSARLIELAGDWQVARFTALVPHPYTGDDAAALLAEAARGEAAGDHLVFAVEERARPGLIGCAGLTIRGQRAEIGYWLGTPYWGKGYATEVVRALTRLGFDELALEALHAEVMADNPASARVLEKAGFQRHGEGTGCRGRCQGVRTVDYGIDRETWAFQAADRPTVLVAAVALVDADGRVLLARRPEGKSMAGLWEFPGGKVHGGETPEAALIRELKEELDIDVSQSCLAPFTFASHAYESFHLLMPLYVCRRWNGTARPLEGQALKWVRPAAMADYPMPPADVPLVAMLRDLL